MILAVPLCLSYLHTATYFVRAKALNECRITVTAGDTYLQVRCAAHRGFPAGSILSLTNRQLSVMDDPLGRVLINAFVL
jgi:hypothetical protein